MALPSREFLIAGVDSEFHRQHPEAPTRLNAEDPAQASLVTAWQHLFTEHLNAMVDNHFHRFYPDSGPLDANKPEDAQLVEYWIDIRDTIGYGATPKYNWDEHRPSEPEDHYDLRGTDVTGTSLEPGAYARKGPKPGLGDAHMDEDQFREYIHAALEGEHYLGDGADVIQIWAQVFGAGEKSLVVEVGEVLGDVGMVTGGMVVIWATISAFGTGTRLQEQEGFCYGVMWQVNGHANAERQFYDAQGDTADELREAFYNGVADGREKAQSAAVHNRIVLLKLWYDPFRDDDDTTNRRVLNDLWLQIRETDAGADELAWPTPYNMRPPGE